MRFRPCIDLHNGKVKQIVGDTLTDDNSSLLTNFETDLPPAHFASMYERDGLRGGHVIMLGPGNHEAARAAVASFPNGLQVGGGITPQNAAEYLDAGASHVIMTSYVFHSGVVDWGRLQEAKAIVGKKHLVLDLSCRKKDNDYFIVTNRWQTFTNQTVSQDILQKLSDFCDEFLVHAVDVEGKQQGIDVQIVEILGEHSPIQVTYAGGIRTIADLETIRVAGQNRVDATIGSALDIFGGPLAYTEVVAWQRSLTAGY
jgi:phosphoribosylformimino-5-aminoimidazole carboxamide ribotide isomerase